ncbi:DUF4397 domain-containing protein [Ferruginibacter paludis]|uniref:DUF4397 domain-containing protein n=1 Tax=Ferruginibacter paludis TaxID=1310417 RepID=UPI0025B2AC58|nr:DUF4397 domain-containing protein [Ferruginibacter paludis]MDN3657331.1 DUF4397 domain-containing protein [Ferruginibacter paludis]
MKKITSYAAALLLMVVAFSACKKSDNNNNIRTPSAGLMAFNLAPDRDAVSFVVSGKRLTNAPLNYNGFTGGYLAVGVGSQEVKSVNPGNDSTLATGTGNFVDSMYYSVFTVGKGGNYRNILVNDSLNSLTVSPGQAYVRFINAIADSAYMPMVTISSGDSNIVNANASFGTISPFTKIRAGNIDVKISNGDSVAATRTIAVDESKVYTVLLTGLRGATDTTKSIQVKYINNGTVK